MFKYTKHSLKKIETIMEDIGYTVRYERGSFQSGYCIVENRNVAVINKFFDTEARINCLLEIISSIDFDETMLNDKSAEFYKKVKKMLEAGQEVLEPARSGVQSGWTEKAE